MEVKKDPSLKGKAFGVGSGVLTTASVSAGLIGRYLASNTWLIIYSHDLVQYEARKFGCRSGMAGFVAKKLCPHIILSVPYDVTVRKRLADTLIVR